MHEHAMATTPQRDRSALRVHPITAPPRPLRTPSPIIHLSILVPMFQEQHRIGPTLLDILGWLGLQRFNSEIVLVDDGSTDRTIDVVRDIIPELLPAPVTRVRLLSHPFNRGKGAAVLTGLRHANGQWVLFMDADAAVPVSETRTLLQAASNERSDAVIATRRAHSASVQMTLLRRGTSRGFSLCMEMLGLRCASDTQCGFKLYSTTAARYITQHAQESGFAFDIEHLLLLKRAGLRIAEQPICWDEKPGGTVKPVRDGVRMLAAASAIRARVGADVRTERHAALPTSVTTKQHSVASLLLFVPVVVLTCLGIMSYLNGRHGDFEDFYFAAQSITLGENPYASYEQGYLYPPLFALLLTPLTLIPFAWAGAAWCCVNGAVMFAATRTTAQQCADSLRVEPARMCWTIGAIAFVLLIDKARAVMMMGQTDAIVLLMCVLALRWYRKKPFRCGAAIAAACMVKYQAIILLPYLILRGRWRETSSFAVCTGTLVLAPSLVFGWGRNLSYLTESFSVLGVVFGAKSAGIADPHPITWDRSVSVTSALARWTESTPVALAISAIIGLAVLALVVRMYRTNHTALFTRRETDAHAAHLTALEWFGLLAVSLIFSPQTEARHMFLALPVIAFASSLLAMRGVSDKRLVCAGIGVFLACMYLPPGGASFDQMVVAWRSVGGASIGLLILTLLVVRASLRVRV